jgi:hypothetical protein
LRVEITLARVEITLERVVIGDLFFLLSWGVFQAQVYGVIILAIKINLLLQMLLNIEKKKNIQAT